MGLDKLKASLNNGSSVIVGVRCEINYSGRAESFLPEGDRILMLKQDGTILVHQPVGSTPINYMKEAVHDLLEEEGIPILRSKAQKEELLIKLVKIHFTQSLALEDGQKLQLKGTEKDMADHIIREPTLISADFTPVSQEEQTKYGFIDVLGSDKEGNLVVVECKRYGADLSAVTQLRRYVEKLKSSKGVDNIRGILAAPKITGNALQMLTDWGFSFVEVHPPKYLEAFDKKQKRLGEF